MGGGICIVCVPVSGMDTRMLPMPRLEGGQGTRPLLGRAHIVELDQMAVNNNQYVLSQHGGQIGSRQDIKVCKAGRTDLLVTSSM